MQRTVPLKGNHDFKRLYSRARSYVTKSLVLYVMKNRRNHNRLGITVSKKLGCAVKRNRAKRVIREAYRLNESNVRTGFDFVVVARGRILNMKTADVQRDLCGTMKNAGVLNQ